VTDQPLVSVITPSYNQGRFIEETILSVIHQDYPSVEHIVVDGGSKDNTLEILRRYGDSIKWISEPDRGFADAVNKGLKMSSGAIFNIMNADDTYYKASAISVMVEGMLANPAAGVVFGDFARIDKDSCILSVQHKYGRKYNYASLLCCDFAFPQDSAFIRRSALEKIGGKLDIGVDWCADFDLFTRIGLWSPIIYLPEVVSTYRVHPGQRNFAAEYVIRNIEARQRVLEKIFSLSDLPSGVVALKHRAFAGTYLSRARILSSSGHVKQAIRCILTATRLQFPYLFSRNYIKTNQFVLIKIIRLIMGGRTLERLINLKRAIRRSKTRQTAVDDSELNFEKCRWWES